MTATAGKYRLERRLGGGGMAEVYVGHAVGAEGFARKVAIKRILGGFSDNPTFAKMFVAEAQISSQLIHPNIVSVIDFDRDEHGQMFLVMELIEGKDLHSLIASGPLPHSVIVYVLGEVLRGLGFAHSAAGDDGTIGIVHRDVSPHNVLLSWEGAVKVSDFGIAKARAATNATASEFIKGKPAYMSPEQANGGEVGGASDLFAVGVMMWELLVGERLFVGGTPAESIAKVLFAPVVPPRQKRASVPADLDYIAMRLLERDLGKRYGTAEEVVADLLAAAASSTIGRDELAALLAERFAAEAPQRARRASALPRGAPPDSTPAADLADRVRRASPARPLPAIAAGVVPKPVDATAALGTGDINVVTTSDTPTRTRLATARRRIWPGFVVGGVVLGSAIGVWIARTQPGRPRRALGHAAGVIDAAPLTYGGTGSAAPDAAIAVAAAPTPLPQAAAPIDAAPARPRAQPSARPPKPAAAAAPAPQIVDKCKPAPGTPSGFLNVFVDPPHATVTVNDKPLGRAPIRAHALSAGCYRVAITYAGKTTIRSATIEPKKTATIELKMQ